MTKTKKSYEKILNEIKKNKCDKNGINNQIVEEKIYKKTIVMTKMVRILNDDKFGDERKLYGFLVYEFFSEFVLQFFCC